MGISLKAARVNSGLTQVKAAALIGISVRKLRMYEQGKDYPDILTINRLFEV